jgi:DNA repair exonuclease SbcCD ATPase subunit
MQDIYIDNIKLTNVANYIESMEMDFPEGLTLITGKNGAGKSTIFKSINLALFGDSGGTDKLPISDFVNRKTKKDLEIILNFRIIENSITDQYTIQLYQDHKKFKNKMILLKNGVDISGKSKTETYQIIENLLIPRSVFLNTVYFSQQVKDFFTSLTNTEQKSIFDSILSTQDYKGFYNNTDKVLKNLISSQTGLDSSLSTLTTTINIQQESVRQFQDSRNRAIQTNENLLSELNQNKILKENELQIQQDAKENTVFDQNRVNKLNSDHYKLQSEKESLQTNIQNEIEKLNKQQKADIAVRISELLAAKVQTRQDISDKFNKEITDLNNQMNVVLTSISETEKLYDTSSLFKDHNSFNLEKQKEINFVNVEIAHLDMLFSTVPIETDKKKRLGIIDNNIQEIKDKASKIKETVSTLKSKISGLEKTINEDESKLNEPTPICSKCHRPFSGSGEVDVIRESIEILRTEVAGLNTKISEYKPEMESLKSNYDETVILKTSTDESYDEKIQEIVNKKAAQSTILIRKRELIQSEISNHKKEIDSLVQEMLTKKVAATAELKKKQTLIESQITGTNKLLEGKLATTEYNYTKDVDSLTQEHIKKYDILREQGKSHFNSQEDTISGQISIIIAELELFVTRRERLDKINVSIQTLSSELKMYNERIIECKNFVHDDIQIQKLNSDIIHNEDRMKELIIQKQVIQKEVAILEFWKEAFSDSGIKSMLIDMAIPHMNESVAQALDKVAPGVFTVSFDTLKMTKSGDVRDKFNVNVLHNIKGTDSHKMLSGGEKRLVDLCCMEALKSLSEKLYGKKFHNIFYDEILDSLDADCCQAFSQASKILAGDKNITLIAHQNVENTEPDRVFNL